jgi:hypothetical protein
MTRDEEIADLQQRIASQQRCHKTRSGLAHRLMMIRLSQLMEENMGTTQSTEISTATTGDPATDADAVKSPEHRVSMAIYFLRDSIRHLQELREANDTADLILGHSFEINTMKVWLENLADDIHKAAHKSAAE